MLLDRRQSDRVAVPLAHYFHVDLTLNIEPSGQGEELEHRGYNTARGVVNDGGDLYAGCGVGQGSWGSWGDLRYCGSRLCATCLLSP